jgi:uncharacterized membrane protein YdbT with pleckstrin-like domain
MIKFNLNPNEQIVLIVRKHWIAIIGQIVALVVVAIIPLILLVGLPFFVPNFPGWQVGHIIYLYTLAYAILLMVSWVTFFFYWTEYQLDIWVVTTHRIFIVEQKGMFYREISSLTLDKIQDLTIDIEGFLPTMLKFGKILVETAGEHKNFAFPNAKNPEAIKIAINSIQKDFYSRPLPVANVAKSPDGSTAGVAGSPNAAQNIGN